MEKLAPESSIDEPVPVFDYDQGANFKLKVKTVKSGANSYPNYDSSGFAEPGPITLNGAALSDEQLEELDSQLLKLEPLVAKSNFKSYSELAQKLSSKIGEYVATEPGGSAPKAAAPTPAPIDTTPFAEDAPAAPAQNDNNFLNDDEEDDDDDFFAKLKNED